MSQELGKIDYVVPVSSLTSGTLLESSDKFEWRLRDLRPQERLLTTLYLIFLYGIALTFCEENIGFLHFFLEQLFYAVHLTCVKIEGEI